MYPGVEVMYPGVEVMHPGVEVIGLLKEAWC